jgi:hypothetical protein
VSGDGSNPADFLWLLLPLFVLAAFSSGAAPAGLAVGFALYFVGPLLGGLIMLAKDRSVRAGMLVAAVLPLLGHLLLLGLDSHRRSRGERPNRPAHPRPRRRIPNDRLAGGPTAAGEASPRCPSRPGRRDTTPAVR